jgi:hypothetical protein
VQNIRHVVRIDTNGRALEHVVKVSKGAHDNVMWVALSNGGPWKITFDKPSGAAGSPFSLDVYQVPQGGNVSTADGPRVGTNAGETYRYNVRNGTTDVITDDPDIDIEG